ncbi:hypothetical protein ACN95_03205 [Gordonia sihwensis]|nr:hypothetical protein [Gordonia sihwensis]
MTSDVICPWCRGCACAPFVHQKDVWLEVCFRCLGQYSDPSEEHNLYSYQECASCKKWFRRIELVLASRPERVSAADSFRETADPRCPDCDVAADLRGGNWYSCPECGIEFKQVPNVA